MSYRHPERVTSYVNLGQFVYCAVCDWQKMDVKNGLGLAAQHCDRTGHKVRVECTSAVFFERKAGE